MTGVAGNSCEPSSVEACGDSRTVAHGVTPLRGVLSTCVLVLALARISLGQDKPNSPAAKSPEAKGKQKADLVPGYEIRMVQGFKLVINRDVLAEIDKLTKAGERDPLEIVEDELFELGRILAPQVYKILQGVRIWIEWDDWPIEVKGARNVIAVYRSGSAHEWAKISTHPLKAGCVEIVSMKKMMERRKEHNQIILLHELCHVVHHLFLGYDNALVFETYKSAMERGLYRGGEGKPRPYASANPFEYFAEISCAYLDRCDYFPHTSDELKKHDPNGYKLMEHTWGRPEAIAAAKEKAAKDREKKAGTRKQPSLTSDAKTEELAASKLESIRLLIAANRKQAARERIDELLKNYPNTPAAAEARKLKESMEK